MKLEFSAGGVVTKKEHGQIFVIVCRPTNHTVWVFPKGRIGDHNAGEGKEETALREVAEESGAVGKILHALTPVTYWYEREGEKRKKTVYFFLMEYLSGDIQKHDWEMEDVIWVPIEKVSETLSYHSDKSAWEEAYKLLTVSSERIAKV